VSGASCAPDFSALAHCPRQLVPVLPLLLPPLRLEPPLLVPLQSPLPPQPVPALCRRPQLQRKA